MQVQVMKCNLLFPTEVAYFSKALFTRKIYFYFLILQKKNWNFLYDRTQYQVTQTYTVHILLEFEKYVTNFHTDGSHTEIDRI